MYKPTELVRSRIEIVREERERELVGRNRVNKANNSCVRVTGTSDKKCRSSCEARSHLSTTQDEAIFDLGQEHTTWVSCCGSVGRAVAYDTRGPRFESGHRQLY